TGSWTTSPWIFPARKASTSASLASKPTNLTPRDAVAVGDAPPGVVPAPPPLESPQPASRPQSTQVQKPRQPRGAMKHLLESSRLREIEHHPMAPRFTASSR